MLWLMGLVHVFHNHQYHIPQLLLGVDAAVAVVLLMLVMVFEHI